MMADDQESLLFLNPEPIRFEPVNKVTAVFFDETNKQVRIFAYPPQATAQPKSCTIHTAIQYSNNGMHYHVG